MELNWKVIFDQIDGYVYCVDVPTYRVVYANARLKEILQEEVVGRPCFEVLQGRSAPCDFCSNSKIFASSRKNIVFEIYNPKLKRHFHCVDIALESSGNLQKLSIAVDITRSKAMRIALEGLVRLLLSLTHNYRLNIEKILDFILQHWEGNQVVYRNREGKFFTAQIEGTETLTQEAWENIFGASLQRKHWRLRRDDLRILVLRVNQSSLLGILKKTTSRSSFPKKLSLLILRFLRWEEERQREELQWFQLFDRSPDLLFLVTRDGKILESNTRASEVLGWGKKLLHGENVELLLGKGTWKALLERTTSIFPPAVELGIENVHGELHPFEAQLSLFDASTEGFYLLSLRDIGERKRYELTLLKLALYDQLTGLYNRRFLEEYLSKELERCRRERYSLSIAFVDIDSFKTINDVYGHVFGDEVLKAVASTMQKMVRASDIVARYGGDEFVMILPRATEESALQVMKRIAKNLRGCQVSGEPFPVRISYGVYTWDGKENLAAIFQEIDRRMYCMKKEGGSS